MEMNQQKGYAFFSAANSNTPSTPFQQHEGQSIPQILQVWEADIGIQQHNEKTLELKFELQKVMALWNTFIGVEVSRQQAQQQGSRPHEDEGFMQRIFQYNMHQYHLYALQVLEKWNNHQEEVRQRAKILRQEQEVIKMKKQQEEARIQEIKRLEEEKIATKTRLAYLTLVVEDWDRFYGVADVFDDDRFPVTRTKYASTPSFLPGDFFALFEDDADADAEIFSTMVEKAEKTSREVNMDNLKGEEQGIVFKMIFFGSLPNGVIVPCDKKVSNEGMVDGTLPSKVGIVQATDVEPRETELLKGDAFVVSKDKDADFVDMLKQGEYQDPFLLDLVGTDDGLLKTKLLLFLRVDLLQGIDVGTVIVYECLLILLKVSCYKGRVRGRVSCVVASWDPGGLCSGLQGFEEWCYGVAGSNFETKFSKRRRMM